MNESRLVQLCISSLILVGVGCSTPGPRSSPCIPTLPVVRPQRIEPDLTALPPDPAQPQPTPTYSIDTLGLSSLECQCLAIAASGLGEALDISAATVKREAPAWPCVRMRSRPGRSDRQASIAPAKRAASGGSAGTRRPVTPSSSHSGMPPTANATAGTPAQPLVIRRGKETIRIMLPPGPLGVYLDDVPAR